LSSPRGRRKISGRAAKRQDYGGLDVHDLAETIPTYALGVRRRNR